jgi:hypothetical protein
MPAVADLPQHGVIWDEHVGEDDLVEMVLAVHQHDRTDRDARRRGLHNELRKARVPMLRVQRAGSGQHHDLMRDVRAARPDLRPVEHPAAAGSGGPRLRCSEVRPRAMLAHSDGRIEPPRGDPRQQPSALVLGAVREQRGCHLPVGDPVRGDGCAVRQQFLGHHVSMQMPKPVSAVLGRDGQAAEAGWATPSSTHCATHPSRFSSTASSRTC